MKKTLPILLLVVVMCLSFAFAACDTTEAVTLTGISIATKPTKLNYKAGEKFDSTGIKVVAEYSDGSTADVTSKCTYTPYGALNVGNTKVTVKYTEEINGEKLTVTAELPIRVTAVVSVETEIVVDITNPTPSDLPHVVVTTSKAPMVFYTYYDSKSMKCESSLELTADSADDNKGMFVYTEMIGHSDRNYRLGRIEGTYTIDGDKMSLAATTVHVVPKLGNTTEPNTTKWANAKTESATIVRDGGTIVGLNFGSAAGAETLWGWKKSDASNFLEGLATQHGLSADVIYMEKVVDGKLSSTQKSYYVVESVGLYKDKDISYGLPQEPLFEGDTLVLPQDMYVAVNYAVPQGSNAKLTTNLPIDHDFTLAIKRGDETLDLDVTLKVGDKLLVTYDGVSGEIDLGVRENPTTPVLRNITVTAPYKSIYKFGETIELDGMKVVANYTSGKASQQIDSSKYTVAVVGSDTPVNEFVLYGTPVDIEVTYTEGEGDNAITVKTYFQVGAPVLPWVAALQSDADFAFVGHARKSETQFAFVAVMLYGDATSGNYRVQSLCTKDNWATAAKSKDHYMYQGTYTVVDGEIVFACPTFVYSSYATGTMFYHPAGVAEGTTNDLFDDIATNGIRATVAVEGDVIVDMTFAKHGLFGFKNSKSVTLESVVNGVVPNAVADKIPSFYADTQAIAKSLVGMKIASPVAKTVYTEGENFVTDGLKIVAYYNDGTSVEVSNITHNATSPLTTDVNKVVVAATVDGETPYTFEFDVTVQSAKAQFVNVEVVGSYKTEYFDGELFDVTNMIVNAVYSDESRVAVSDFTIVDGEKALTQGMTKVVVSYLLADEAECRTVDVAITVGSAKLLSLQVGGEYKNNYVEGDKFDTTGLVVTANYTNGSRNVTDQATIVNKDGALDLTVTKMTVRYDELETTVDITVAMIAPWLRAENSTAQHVFAAYAAKSSKQASWSSVELYSDGTFRASHNFMSSKDVAHWGSYSVDGTTVTFVVSGCYNPTNTSAFVADGTFVATLVKDGETVVGLTFEYAVTDGNDVMFGFPSKDSAAVTLDAVVGGKLGWDVLAKIPSALRTLDRLETECEAVLSYTEGDQFDFGAMKVTAVYSDGAVYDVTSVCAVTPAQLAVDTTQVTIAFGGQQVTVDGITVNVGEEVKLADIVVGAPTKVSYRLGEKVNLAGMSVTAKYSGGAEDKLVESGYTVAVKDSTVALADTYLNNGTTTLVVTYAEGDVSVSKEIEVSASYVEPWTVATQSTADNVFVTYAVKKTGNKGHFAWSAMELFGDMTNGGSYIVTIRFTTSGWNSGNNVFVYAGTYTVSNGKVTFADPSQTLLYTDKASTSVFYNTAKVDAVSGGFVADVTSDTALTFAYSDKTNDTFFSFSSVNDTPVVFEKVVDGVIPESVSANIPTLLSN